MSSVTLYSSPISDCSARLRIALNLKQVDYKIVPVIIRSGQNQTDEYAALNAAKTVPTLVHQTQENVAPAVVTQSGPALEYIEEAFSGTSLLPPIEQHQARATVRTLVSIIASDIHPLTTHRVRLAICNHFTGPQADLANDSGDRTWTKYWISRGLDQYERIVKDVAGSYSVGDCVTMADVCLVPQIWTALRLGVDLGNHPMIEKIYTALSQLPAVINSRQDPSSELA